MNKENLFVQAAFRYAKDPFAMFGLLVVLTFTVVAVFAPLLANDRPLVMRYDGSLYFPAFRQLLFFESLFNEYPFYHDTDPLDFYADNEDLITTYVEAPIPWAPNDINSGRFLRAPDELNWLGTDELGRDILSRMIHGTGTALRVGFISTGIALLIGIIMGSIAGFYGGLADNIIMRMVEVFMCIPTIFLLLTVVAFLPPTEFNIMAAIGFVGWTSSARLVRAEFIRLRGQEFTTAARALGASDLRIIFLHVLPNSLAPLLVVASFGVASAMLSEATLSFLGLGIRPPQPTWGNILSKAKDYIQLAWWMTLYPGIAIFLGVLSYNLVGEGLRDALDPRLRE